MKIAIGSDHKGFEHKKYIIQKLKQYTDEPVTWLDVGCFSSDRCDYPEFAQLVANYILAKEVDLGILLCGSGIGMTIAANRFKNIYAGLCWNPDVAKSAREDDNVNILVLPANFVTQEQSLEIINSWLSTAFKGGHYQKRLEQIDK